MSEGQQWGPVSAAWQQPLERPSGCGPIARRLAGFGLLGVPLAIGIAYGVCRLIAEVWAACDDAEPPYLFSLLVLGLPIIAAIAWTAWMVVVAFTVRARWWLALPIGVLVMVCVGYLGIMSSAPMGEPGDYSEVTLGEDLLPATCGPDGIPTWWPTWAPL